MKLYHPDLSFEVLEWLANHGYTHHTGSILKIHISLTNVEEGEQIPHFQKLISVDEIHGKTIEELELFDQNIWLQARFELTGFMARQSELKKTGGSLKWKNR